MATPGAAQDRWIEVDLDWFAADDVGARTEDFAARCAPLLRAASGERGVILNAGWLADIVMEFTGDPAQALPFRSRRYRHWQGRSYSDLARFVRRLRVAFRAEGIQDCRVGIFVAGLGHVLWPPDSATLYDLRSSWSERHPELYPLDVSLLPGPDLDPRVALHADDYPYASRPTGVEDGETFGQLLADQWAALADLADLDVIHLRDGFWGPMLYARVGPYGVSADADPDENASWTAAVVDLIRRVKRARPGATVMAYSSGVSHTAEWRVGCVDLHAVVADGHLDVFIDQTWGGAWEDWWGQQWKGWTFQLANLLGHAAQLRDANQLRPGHPCRHYAVIETWDGWEPWDTLHRTPGKLEWAIWAFSHAAVVTPDGLEVIDGAYLSWMTNPEGQLLAPSDIAFLVDTLDAVSRSVAGYEQVLGPRMVLDRAAVSALADAEPDGNASEWIEDQVGMLLKWGVPVLSASVATPDVGAPGRPGEVTLHQLPSESAAEGTTIGIGRFDVMPGLLVRLGVTLAPDTRSDGYRLDGSSPSESVHLPTHRTIAQIADAAVEVRYTAGGSPSLLGVPQAQGRTGTWLWQPPDLHSPANAHFPRNQYGSVEPYRAVAAVISESSTDVSTRVPDAHAPIVVSCWRGSGQVHLLLGNLDSGWIGDSRWPRTADLRLLLPGLLGDDPVIDAWHSSSETSVPELRMHDDGAHLTVHVPPSGMVHLTLSPRERP